jgi:hypothetical protein
LRRGSRQPAAHCCGKSQPRHSEGTFGSRSRSYDIFWVLRIFIIYLISACIATLADDEGNTAVHFAAKTGASISVELLLDKCKDPQQVSPKIIIPISLHNQYLFSSVW